MGYVDELRWAWMDGDVPEEIKEHVRAILEWRNREAADVPFAIPFPINAMWGFSKKVNLSGESVHAGR